MGYRHPDDRDRCCHAHDSFIPVNNGTITRISIPCFSRDDERPPWHDRPRHDHEGWPDPDNPDESCQGLPPVYDQIIVMNEIDLVAEGYDTIDVSLLDPPDGLTVTGEISQNMVNLTVVAMCEAAEKKGLYVPFAVYAIGTVTGTGGAEDLQMRDLVTKGTLHVCASPIDDTSWWVTPSISDQINGRLDDIEDSLGNGAISVTKTDTGEIFDKVYRYGGQGWYFSPNGYPFDIVDPVFSEGVTVRVSGQVYYGSWSADFDVSHTFTSDSEETYHELMPGENSNPNDWSNNYTGVLTIFSNGHGHFLVTYRLDHDVPPDHEIVSDPIGIANAYVEVGYKVKETVVDIQVNESHITVDNHGVIDIIDDLHWDPINDDWLDGNGHLRGDETADVMYLYDNSLKYNPLRKRVVGRATFGVLPNQHVDAGSTVDFKIADKYDLFTVCKYTETKYSQRSGAPVTINRIVDVILYNDELLIKPSAALSDSDFVEVYVDYPVFGRHLD